jgi:nicotinic acetylcholine receptor
MLSILTLLTFWLPPTSGEKITLGLSVFLAFSMFMLLIAEEVPATSEAVPLIGKQDHITSYVYLYFSDIIVRIYM